MPADRILQPAIPVLVASGAMAVVLAGLRMMLAGTLGDPAPLGVAALVGALIYGSSARVLFPRLVRDALGVARVMAARRT